MMLMMLVQVLLGETGRYVSVSGKRFRSVAYEPAGVAGERLPRAPAITANGMSPPRSSSQTRDKVRGYVYRMVWPRCTFASL